MALVSGVHHLTFLTRDLDRLIGFYARVFDARVTFDRVEEGGVRHGFIAIGSNAVLHPFEVPGAEIPGREGMFERGRFDHFALAAASEDAFREIRRRVVAEGMHATEGGLVTDMGTMLSFTFHDPDDMWCEVMWEKADAPSGAAPNGPETWRMIELDRAD
jgi:catechol 2,3-dioxygenase-like lactoylglutathione lyase family enzyme